MEYRATKTWPYHVSCGGAVYKEENGKRLYALLFRGERFGKHGNTWHLPKGTLRSDETLGQCALREIKEETGLVVEMTAYLGAIHDAWQSEDEDKDIDKTTHYFLCHYVSGDGSEMDQEHDEVQWLEVAIARERLALVPKNEAEVIDRAERCVQNNYGCIGV